MCSFCFGSQLLRAPPGLGSCGFLHVGVCSGRASWQVRAGPGLQPRCIRSLYRTRQLALGKPRSRRGFSRGRKGPVPWDATARVPGLKCCSGAVLRGSTSVLGGRLTWEHVGAQRLSYLAACRCPKPWSGSSSTRMTPPSTHRSQAQPCRERQAPRPPLLPGPVRRKRPETS